MDKLKGILGKMEVKNTSDDFTKNVMMDIYSLEKEKAFDNILKENLMQKTSADFTESVLDKIEGSTTKANSVELFSGTHKIIIGTLFSILVVISFFSKSENVLFKESLDFSLLTFFNSKALQIPPILTWSLFTILILLLIDYHFLNKNETT